MATELTSAKATKNFSFASLAYEDPEHEANKRADKERTSLVLVADVIFVPSFKRCSNSKGNSSNKEDDATSDRSIGIMNVKRIINPVGEDIARSCPIGRSKTIRDKEEDRAHKRHDATNDKEQSGEFRPLLVFLSKSKPNIEPTSNDSHDDGT